MMRNTVSKVCRTGMQYRMQYRGCSSVAAVTTGKKFFDYCFIGACSVAGYVFGGLTVTPVRPADKEVERLVHELDEEITRELKELDANYNEN